MVKIQGTFSISNKYCRSVIDYQPIIKNGTEMDQGYYTQTATCGLCDYT